MQINLKASERFFVLFCPDSSDIEYKPTGLQSTDWSVKRFYPECSFLFLPIELGWQLQCKLKLISLSFYLLRLRALSWLGLPGNRDRGSETQATEALIPREPGEQEPAWEGRIRAQGQGRSQAFPSAQNLQRPFRASRTEVRGPALSPPTFIVQSLVASCPGKVG